MARGYARKVKQYDLDGNFVAEFSSIIEAAKTLDLSDKAIGQALKGASRTSGGFKWVFGESNLKRLVSAEVVQVGIKHEDHLHSQLSDMEDQIDYLKDRIANLEDANSRMLNKILGD